MTHDRQEHMCTCGAELPCPTLTALDAYTRKLPTLGQGPSSAPLISSGFLRLASLGRLRPFRQLGRAR